MKTPLIIPTKFSCNHLDLFCTICFCSFFLIYLILKFSAVFNKLIQSPPSNLFKSTSLLYKNLKGKSNKINVFKTERICAFFFCLHFTYLIIVLKVFGEILG